ncbi:MAG: pyrroline-5-carboxylate reductase [Varibaculum sp.]|nr:pyrroline-5-carboxylate reductase [Varibaculum sp.]
MRIGFIGAGSMGSAIIGGAIESGKYRGSDFVVTDVNSEKAQSLAGKYSLTALASVAEVIAGAEMIVLAVKPQHQGDILANNDWQGRLLVSIAAGRATDTIAAEARETRVVRVMPNVNALIGQAACGICSAEGASETDMQAVRELFATCGTVDDIDESLFGAFSALAGCSPAWVYRMINSMAAAGVAAGLPKATATRVAAQAFSGSAQMVLSGLANGRHPESLVDMVTSPGGTTIAGLLAGESAGMSVAIQQAVRAAITRDAELD